MFVNIVHILTLTFFYDYMLLIVSKIKKFCRTIPLVIKPALLCKHTKKISKSHYFISSNISPEGFSRSYDALTCWQIEALRSYKSSLK